jgi:ankyrin repeat protein
MKMNSRTGLLALIVALFCEGCFLIPPPRSAYRPIHQYAQAGDAASVAADLATNSPDLNLPDDAGLTPLHLAASHCHTNVIALLLSKGASVNKKGQGGVTPLHLAAQDGCADAVTLLLAHHAKINARDDTGRTPLKRAEEWHQDAVAQLLRQHGGTE